MITSEQDSVSRDPGGHGGPVHPRTVAVSGGASIFCLPSGVRHAITDRGEAGFILRRGCLLLDVKLPDGRRHVHILHYPGDTIVPQALPPEVDVGMLALSDCQLDQIPVGDIGPAAPLAAQRRAGRQYPVDVVARSAIHSAAVGRLSVEERLATLLLEMALYLGFSAPGGRVLDQPLARKDIADLLGLNPDTLSRMMTRLRTDGIISVPTRGRMIIRDIGALSELTPLASSVKALHRMTQAPEAA